MAYRHRKIRPHYFINLGLSLLVLASFTVAGAKIAGISRAATTNPYGFADYCLLENNTTVIYGWGADPNATSLSDPQVTLNAGGHSVTVFTNQAGYHDTDINTWIDKNRPGDPKPGTYGFRAPMPGLYKGNSYTLTGVVLNVGPGSSTILTINNTGYNKGDTTHPYFANNLIPDACLATAPTPPPPPPTPQPGPSPAPNPSPGPRPTPSPVVPTKTPDTAPKSAPSNAVDTTVTVGTLAVSIAVPADNATAVHLVYGTSPVELNQSTPDQTVSGDPTTIPITGLAAATDYYYQIVRSDTGQTSTSPTTGFTTLGYSVALHFVDNHDRGIQDIPASLDGQKSTQKSDNDGTVLFNDITTGDHTFWYTYNSKKYRKDVSATADTVNPDDAAKARVITLNYTVNLETLSGGTPAAKANKKIVSLVAAIVPASVAVLAIILGIIGYTRRRRKNRYQDYYEDFPSMGLPEYQKAAPPPEPTPPDAEFQPLPPAAIDTVPKPEDAAHLGESLKEMVLRSMAEEAKKRETEDK